MHGHTTIRRFMRLNSYATIYALGGMALAIIAWAYWPGLDGPFLFDDYSNLDVLGAFGQIDNWHAFLYYITSGAADPTGRPIALLTFLIDANSWPASPWPFKRTNVALHLINTALLAVVMVRLQAALQRKQPEMRFSPLAPLLGASLWAAHPFFVSTTLYVVQREAMLPLTFVLLSLLAWDRAVSRFNRQQDRAGWSWAIIGMGGATLLAGLSKANGFLAPLLVGVAHLWFFRPVKVASSARFGAMDKAAMICLALPSSIVLIYLFQTGWHLWSVPQLEGRDWTLPERLLSQPRALWTYVFRLAVPRAGGGGVYVDDFSPSHGWLDPVTTLPALLALLASTLAAVTLQRRFPTISFAWLFFLTGHLLEGSTIPLELYFEHRNYLPAALLGWPLAHVLLRPGSYGTSRAMLAAACLCGLLLLTHQRALVWGDEAVLSALSAQHQPESPRAQVIAAREEIRQGNISAALSRIHAMQDRHPNSIDVAVNAIGFECNGTHALSPDTFARARQSLTHATSWNWGLYKWMQSAASDPVLRNCRGFGLVGLKMLVASAEANPQSVTQLRKRDLWHVRGRIALAEGRPEIALRWFDAALLLKPDAEYALVQAAALGDAGAQGLGVEHLDHYQRIDAGSPQIRVRDMGTAHAWLLRHFGYYDKELSSLRQRLSADEASPTRTTKQHQ